METKMHGFDLDQLQTFVAAIEAGSLTAAAPRRFLSQSSVSEQLQKLEARAGQPLLLRSKAGVTPTPAGLRLLGHARQLLALSDAAWRDLQGAPLAGELRLALSEYFRPGELTTLLAGLHHQYPQIRLHVQMDKSDAIHAAYARGEFDVAVTMQVAGLSDKATTGKTLRREPLHWVGNRQALPAKGTPLRLVSLSAGCSLRRLAVERLEARGLPYVIAHVASGVAGIQSAVSAGLGIACLNASSCSADIVPVSRQWGLPALPQVAFKIAAARPGEDARLGAMRTLIEHTLQH